MVTVIMTIHMETNTKRAIIENERSARVKRGRKPWLRSMLMQRR